MFLSLQSPPPVTSASAGARLSPPHTLKSSSPLSAVPPLPPLGLHRQPSSSPHCCDNGRPILTHPISGQTICSCQYNPAMASSLAALYNYPRVPGLPEALVSSAMVQAQGLGLSLGPPPPPLCAPTTPVAPGVEPPPASLYPGLVSRCSITCPSM